MLYISKAETKSQTGNKCTPNRSEALKEAKKNSRPKLPLKRNTAQDGYCVGPSGGSNSFAVSRRARQLSAIRSRVFVGRRLRAGNVFGACKVDLLCGGIFPLPGCEKQVRLGMD